MMRIAYLTLVIVPLIIICGVIGGLCVALELAGRYGRRKISVLIRGAIKCAPSGAKSGKK